MYISTYSSFITLLVLLLSLFLFLSVLSLFSLRCLFASFFVSLFLRSYACIISLFADCCLFVCLFAYGPKHVVLSLVCLIAHGLTRFFCFLFFVCLFYCLFVCAAPNLTGLFEHVLLECKTLVFVCLLCCYLLALRLEACNAQNRSDKWSWR